MTSKELENIISSATARPFAEDTDQDINGSDLIEAVVNAYWEAVAEEHTLTLRSREWDDV